MKKALFIFLVCLFAFSNVKAEACYYEFPKIEYVDTGDEYYCYLKLDITNGIEYYLGPHNRVPLKQNNTTHVFCEKVDARGNEELLNQNGRNYVYRIIDGVVDNETEIDISSSSNDSIEKYGENLTFIINHQYLSAIETDETTYGAMKQGFIREEPGTKGGTHAAVHITPNVCPHVYAQLKNATIAGNSGWPKEISVASSDEIPEIFLSYDTLTTGFSSERSSSCIAYNSKINGGRASTNYPFDCNLNKYELRNISVDVEDENYPLLPDNVSTSEQKNCNFILEYEDKDGRNTNPGYKIIYDNSTVSVEELNSSDLWLQTNTFAEGAISNIGKIKIYGLDEIKDCSPKYYTYTKKTTSGGDNEINIYSEEVEGSKKIYPGVASSFSEKFTGSCCMVAKNYQYISSPIKVTINGQDAKISYLDSGTGVEYNEKVRDIISEDAGCPPKITTTCLTYPCELDKQWLYASYDDNLPKNFYFEIDPNPSGCLNESPVTPPNPTPNPSAPHDTCDELSVDRIKACGCIPAGIADLTSKAYFILQIIGPVLLLILGGFEMAKAVSTQDESAIEKAKKKLVNKFIAAAAIFFVFTIMQFLVNLLAKNATGIIECVDILLNGYVI